MGGLLEKIKKIFVKYGRGPKKIIHCTPLRILKSNHANGIALTTELDRFRSLLVSQQDSIMRPDKSMTNPREILL